MYSFLALRYIKVGSGYEFIKNSHTKKMISHYSFNVMTIIIPGASPSRSGYMWWYFIGWLGIGAAETCLLDVAT